MKSILLISIFLMVFIKADIAYGYVPVPHSPPPVNPNVQTVGGADGWVICGDEASQKPTGDGCREMVGKPSFFLANEYKTTPYREFLKVRKPNAKYLGVQLYYLPNDTRAIIYYQN